MPSEVDLPVMLIVDLLSLASIVQHSLFPASCLCLHCSGYYIASSPGPSDSRVGRGLGTRLVIAVPADHMQCRVRIHVHDDHYLTHSKFNSLLTEMITPRTLIIQYIHIKPLPVSRVFGARSCRLAPNNSILLLP